MHVSCHIQSTWPSHSPSFLSSLILIISGGRYNLCCYISCSFLQFPITLSHKTVRTDQHCSQTQSTVFPQCHRPSVPPTTIKTQCKHRNVYTSIASFRKAGRTAKHYEPAVCIAPHSFSLNFFTLQSLLLNATPKYFQNFKQRIIYATFLWCDIHTVPLKYIVREETWPVNAQLHCTNFQWQLQSSHY